MTPESNIQRVESPEVADMTMKSEVEDAPVVPRYEDDREPTDDYEASAGVKAATGDL